MEICEGKRVKQNIFQRKVYVFEVSSLHGHRQLSCVDHVSPDAGDDLHYGGQHKVEASEGAGNAISLTQKCGQLVGPLHVTESNYLMMGCRKFDNLIKCKLSTK